MSGPADPLGWARRPQSRLAIERVHELARKDRRFLAIWDELKRERVVNADGKPLALWDGAQWKPIRG